MHRLLLKTHKITKLKYLCYTQTENFVDYSGSGLRWKKHLKKHGNHIDTEVLFTTDKYEELKKVAEYYSSLWKVEESEEFANLIPEKGCGGSTTHIYQWINNGKENRYIKKSDIIEEGWKKGRICKFNDPAFQSIMSKRAKSKETIETKNARVERMRKLGLSQKGKKNPHVAGDKNPSKRPEVLMKIKNAAINRAKKIIICPNCGKIGKDSVGMLYNHFDKCKKKL